MSKYLRRRRWPMAPDLPCRCRHCVQAELRATLAAIEAELGSLDPHLSKRTPPAWAVVQKQELLNRSLHTCEMLRALEDAAAATMH